MTTKTKEEISEKFKNNCPLDHSTYEKFISCDCNFGSSIEVWYFKEQTIQQQKELIEEFVQISEHAIDLGYLGEGSTVGEFQKIIEKAKELLK